MSDEPAWVAVERPPRLGGEEIHLWVVDLRLGKGRDDFLNLLSPDELTRYRRYRFEIHRQRFLACRAATRQLLAAYLGTDPAGLEFEYSDLGKPALADGGVEFNVSNSEDAALIAVTRGVPVGCDIEHLPRRCSFLELAERFFSPEEIAALRALPTAEQRRGFFAAWTRKEAILKCTGKGLTTPLDEVTVSLGPAESPRVLRIADDSGEAAAWRLAAAAFGSDYLCAVAHRGGDRRIRHLQHRLD